MRKQPKKRKNKKVIIVIVIIVLILTTLAISLLTINNILYNKHQEEILANKISLIKSHYNDLVVTNKNTDLYLLKDNEYVTSGYISKDTFIKLEEESSNYEKGYFKISSLEADYYINYLDIEKVEEERIYNQRYKTYIPYNKTIVTNETFSLYDSEDILKYTFSHQAKLKIIVNNQNLYGVEFDNQLLYIKPEDIHEIIDETNTNLTNTKGISVLNYHFVYDETKSKCNQIICHTEKQFKSHLEYIKSNNIFTPTLKELEMYLDKQIQLPKSVVITIDDGWHSLESAALLNEYQLNGTVFVITSEYNPQTIASEYVETHSHTHDLHDGGKCPGGQGGGIKCLSEKTIQEDLKKSRDRLNNTTYFCYPFYEYNSYSIQQLKKAGFTMAFAGYNANGQLKAKPGIDKYQIPRYVIYNYTTVSQIKQYIG